MALNHGLGTIPHEVRRGASSAATSLTEMGSSSESSSSSSTSDSAIEVRALMGENDTALRRERLRLLPWRTGCGPNPQSNVKRLCVGGQDMPLLTSSLFDFLETAFFDGFVCDNSAVSDSRCFALPSRFSEEEPLSGSGGFIFVPFKGRTCVPQYFFA
eukprot:CAMPEP_0184475036 /NCGR_PEP_ID=MMETSP0740-20130409/141570_1 /TAXON_ID=385413 /ORGANISM="Thalassiosira miniscula, Strain CCMP1093" /LENGTH=157 /DNA_ID=CAMNT_0026852417 /DNA_START=44 /DNA_END=517 /DNA_ORIENTATION=+